MSPYQPQVGDEVRVVCRGVVTRIGPRGYFETEHSEFVMDDEIVSVEKVTPPLPTTPGSVIRVERDCGRFYVLQDDGEWSPGHYDAEDFAADDGLLGVTVISDAGAER